MLQTGEDGEIPFYKAIKCAMTVQMNKIISSDSDLVGILLYGTVGFVRATTQYSALLIARMNLDV